MVDIPKFSGGPGEAYLKVIKMVEYLNEKMHLLAKCNGYHVERQKAQQDQAILELEEPVEMPTKSRWVLETTEQASEEKVDKTLIPCKSNHQLWEKRLIAEQNKKQAKLAAVKVITEMNENFEADLVETQVKN